jgi:hypothetical protein
VLFSAGLKDDRLSVGGVVQVGQEVVINVGGSKEMWHLLSMMWTLVLASSPYRSPSSYPSASHFLSPWVPQPRRMANK